MAVHMIRVTASAEGDYSLDQLNAAMDDWVSKQSEWTADPITHQISERGGDDGAPVYRGGNYRFLLDDAKDNLLQKCENKLTNKVAWYRLGYHSCDHDETAPSPCSWDDQREWTDTGVTIPDNVPVFVEGG